MGKLYSFTWFCQCLLSTGLVLQAWKEGHKNQIDRAVSVDDSGMWTSLNEKDNNVWKIASGSRVSSFLLWVELVPQGQRLSMRNKWLWVFPDSVNQVDYRRLSRIIIRRQQTDSEETPSYG